jgi:nucleotide-binding universal stress UspA family protein
MKTIIALTDFSPNATHAAHFALKLAKNLKSNLLLCNAYLLPTGIPSPYTIGWPMEEYNMLADESADMLGLLKDQLEAWEPTLEINNGFTPQISVNSSFGNLCSVIESLASTNDISMVVSGIHDKDALSTFLQGNNMKNMISDLRFPLLIVPSGAGFADINRIAFATDLTTTKDDVQAIKSLNKLIEPLQAEILLTTVNDKENYPVLNEQFMDEILHSIALKNKTNLNTTRVLRSDNIEQGLIKLCKEEDVNLLVMVHHHFNLLKRFFKGSHTLEMAENIHIPLLIFN